MKTPTLIAILFSIACLHLQARDYSQLYSREELKAAHAIYTDNIRAVLYEDLAAYLTPEELKSLNKVKLLQPWNRIYDPFEFSANSATNEIIIPAFSIKFLDDMSVAMAWYERHACDKTTLEDYVAALDFSQLSLQSPLKTLQVPANAYELDAFVNDISQKLLKDAVAFLLLHELAHIHYQHKSYDLIDAKTAQEQETQADQFALSVFQRMQSPPMGISFWFMLVAYRDPLIPHSPTQTHPLTASRLQMIADHLRKNPKAFISYENRNNLTVASIESLANNIEVIAQVLKKPDLRDFIRQRGKNVTLELLHQGCANNRQESWMDLLKKLTQ